jgi:tripartite-type tricarboxylate transporter receptor subunit TctC
MLSGAKEICQAGIPIGIRAFDVMLLALFPALQAEAQNYPDKAVRMVVPYAPGGSVDVMARILAPKLTGAMGQQVVVDNRPGASGNIGTEMAVHAPADGYTILMVTIPLVVNPSLYAKLPFDVVKDLAPVSLLAASSFLMVIHPSLPVRSVKELIALAKREPGKLNYPSGGNGTNSHIATELFKNLTGTQIVHVPYKGGGPALIAVLSGESDVAILGFDVVMSHVRAGRLRALGICGTQRSSALPNLPTIAEAGVQGYEFSSWYGVLAPAATPAGLINALNEYLAKAMRAPDLVERFAKDGTEVIVSSSGQFASHIRVELARWARVVKAAGLRAD